MEFVVDSSFLSVLEKLVPDEKALSFALLFLISSVLFSSYLQWFPFVFSLQFIDSFAFILFGIHPAS